MSETLREQFYRISGEHSSRAFPSQTEREALAMLFLMMEMLDLANAKLTLLQRQLGKKHVPNRDLILSDLDRMQAAGEHIQHRLARFLRPEVYSNKKA